MLPPYLSKHIGSSEEDISNMLNLLGFSTLDELISQVIPVNILNSQTSFNKNKNENHNNSNNNNSNTNNRETNNNSYCNCNNNCNCSENMMDERQLTKEFKKIGNKNKLFKNFIGQGFFETITPPIILKNLLENPKWYTAYTPYQAEISQGRLEVLFNFQRMIQDITSMDIANASLLDEASAAAEAMIMSMNINKKKSNNNYFVSNNLHPQIIRVLKTRARYLNINLIIDNHDKIFNHPNIFGAIFPYPDTYGEIIDYSSHIEFCHKNNTDKNINNLVTINCEPLSLTLLKPPGDFDADIVVGSVQRFGLPLGFGGPHAAFLACKKIFYRNIPGRIVGISQDTYQKKCYRLALQTREQHIRREKATSNICTSQVLLANMATMFAIYHGPKKLKNIAQNIFNLTHLLVQNLTTINSKNSKLKFTINNKLFFDTINIRFNNPDDTSKIINLAENNGFLFRKISPISIGITINETNDISDINKIYSFFNCINQNYDLQVNKKVHDKNHNKNYDKNYDKNCNNFYQQIENKFYRTSNFLSDPIFNSHHSELKLLRYIENLQNKDLSLSHSMIPLGSCTMKSTPTIAFIPTTWENFSNIHPFSPAQYAEGYKLILKDLNNILCPVLGMEAISFQPNAGSQGEYAGLIAIREYQISNKEEQRKICLIPTSAHGTNPASAHMAGMQIISIECDINGNINIKDLREKAYKHKETLSCLMITYPSTHGVFEEKIEEICQIIHENGGQVYMDGANLNAMVGLVSPGKIGIDVCHINLHKTFAIPHGGGGPGVGPIAVKNHLINFLPEEMYFPEFNFKTNVGPVSAAPYGSANILLISWCYLKLMQKEGLIHASKIAILNANYIAKKLENYFSCLYKGKNNLVAHECILDCRELKPKFKINVEDIAKRLMDYGFHAPTISWPVPETMMIEPTESESKEEIDRFCDALINIRKEIQNIINNQSDISITNNPTNIATNILKNAPHTISDLILKEWDRPYTKESAFFPLSYLKENKFWPSVNRIDNSWGDGAYYLLRGR